MTKEVSNDAMRLIYVTQDDINITKDTNLNIFKNYKYGGEKIIAPKLSGDYDFSIKNVTDKEKLNTSNITILKDSINTFTLEWYWEDDDLNDTYVGIQKIDEHYKLNLKIQAEEEYNT